MEIIALDTFSTGVISMWKGEIREISDADSDYEDYQTLLTEGTCIEEYHGKGEPTEDFVTVTITCANDSKYHVYCNSTLVERVYSTDTDQPFTNFEVESKELSAGQSATCKVLKYSPAIYIEENITVSDCTGNIYIPSEGDVERYIGSFVYFDEDGQHVTVSSN